MLSDRWHRSVLVLGFAALNIGSLGVAAVVIMHMTTAAPLNAADPKISIYCRRRKRRHYHDHNVTTYLRASLRVYSCCAYYAPAYLTVCLVHRRRLMAAMCVCLMRAHAARAQCGCVFGTLGRVGGIAYAPCRIIE